MQTATAHLIPCGATVVVCHIHPVLLIWWYTASETGEFATVVWYSLSYFCRTICLFILCTQNA
jgi:hypothetical protein